MTDLEITKLCAEALNCRYVYPGDAEFINAGGELERFRFDPLHDDAQALMLLKSMRLFVAPPWRDDNSLRWEVWWEDSAPVFSDDLNRAICECVATARLAKGKN